MTNTLTVREVILNLLLRIEKDNSYSHVLIDESIKTHALSQKDQALLTEVVYGTINRQMTLDYYLDHFIRKPKSVDRWVRVLLRFSLYQMIYLDRIPNYAIFNEAVKIARQRGHQGIASLVNGILRNIQRKGLPELPSPKDPIKRLAIETSHPEWLIKRWKTHYGWDVTEKMCHHYLKKKPRSVRIQPLRISLQEAQEQLAKESIYAIPSKFSNQGLVIKEGNVRNSLLHQKGLLTIQDQTSMLVSEMLQVNEDTYVLDTCSAPGGKVTHIAEIMNNKGKIEANDIHRRKIKQIERKAKLLQLSNIQTHRQDARKLHNTFEAETFDRILVDAPCSGLGVIQSKPDIKYSKSLEDLERLTQVQLEILLAVAPLLKRGGLLIYSTCTVERTENEEVVQKFLKKQKDFNVDPDFFTQLPPFLQKSSGVNQSGLQIFPHMYETDGFFLTRLRRL